MVLSDSPVDLLITDQIMPEGTGLEFLQRTLQEFPDLQRALITAYGHLDLVRQALNEGKIHWYLEKPWNEEQLIGVMRAAYTEATDRDHRREQINRLARQLFHSRQRLNGLIDHLVAMGDDEGATLARSIQQLLQPE
jgi:YesN/AraC family two-component response regulator